MRSMQSSISSKLGMKKKWIKVRNLARLQRADYDHGRLSGRKYGRKYEIKIPVAPSGTGFFRRRVTI